MTIEHVNIPDGDRHEPKDISTATLGSVYVANGAASGAWGSPLGVSDNRVIVTSSGDLPDAVAGYHILEAKQYLIEEGVDLGSNGLTFIDGSSLQGIGFTQAVISSTANPAVQAANGIPIIIEKCTLFSSTGTNVAIQSSGAALAFEIGAIVGFDKAISMVNATDVILRLCEFDGVSTCITIAGTCDSFTAERVRLQGYAVAGVDLTGSLIQQPNFSLCNFSGNVGSFGIMSDAGSVNVGIRGRISDCNFNGDGEPLNNIVFNDLLWETTLCQSLDHDIINSTDFGWLSFHANTVETEIANSDEYTDITPPVAGWTEDANNSRFKSDAAGELEYEGIWDFVGKVVCNVSVSTQGGGEKTLGLAIFEDDILLPDSEVTGEADNAGRSVTTSAPVSLTAGKRYKVRIKNISDDSDLDVISARVSVERM